MRSSSPSLVSSSEDLTIKDPPATPSDNDSVYSATKEMDEPVGPPPTATDESTTVQSPHRMDQQETSESQQVYISSLSGAVRKSIIIDYLHTCVHFSVMCILTCLYI